MSAPALSYEHGASPIHLIGETVGVHFDRIVAAHGNRLALVVRHQNIRWSYAELAARVDALAAGLLALGLEPGDRIGIWSPNCAEWVLTRDGDQELTVGGIVEENPPWSGPSPGLVQELNRRVQASGTQLVIMAVPSRYRLMGDGKLRVDSDFHAKVKAWSAEHAVDFLDLSDAFDQAAGAGPELFFRQDIHFTAAGHAVTAATIARVFPALFPRNPATRP